MDVVISWLEDYVDISGISLEELAERWTLAGLEVEGIERVGDWWDRERLLVGAVTRVEPHPNADRLVLAWVDYGAGEAHQVVTGAPILLPLREAGDLERPLKVVYAMEGVELFDGYSEGWVKTTLKGRKVRGIMSDAMVCSEKELGLADEHEDIMVLDADAPIGTPLADYLGDAIVSIDLTPNLARAMSMIGIARETAAILDRPFEAPERGATKAGGRAADFVEVEIRDPDLCSRYTARVIRDVSMGPSPGWMARRLRLAGMRPINCVVDVTNYVMLEWGEPLHAFDYDALCDRVPEGRPKIVVRRARDGEAITTLDDISRTLDTETLLITDEAGPLAIAGVMGGAETEVSDSTTNVLLEAASFDFINIRRTSKLQKLPSESAARFGRGVHSALADPASIRAANLMGEIGSGSVVDGVVDEFPRPAERVAVSLPAGETKRLLGIDIPIEDAAAILERLEFDVAIEADGGLTAEVPPHRLDVAIAADLVEEVARIYGYDKLPSTRLADPLPPQRDNEALAREELARDSLAAAGLQEIASVRLVAPEHELALLPSDTSQAEVDDNLDYVTLENPISPERSALRQSILTGLLDAARANLRFTDRVALFEVGPVYLPQEGELPSEPRRVGLVMAGPVGQQTWRGRDERLLDFHDAKGAVTSLLEAMVIEAEWVTGDHPSMHPARTAAVVCGEVTLGHVGELQPLVRDDWGLADMTVAVADLDLDAMAEAAGQAAQFEPFSSYPPVREDLAVVVDDRVPAGEVAAVIREAGGTLLVDLGLFDVYRGSQIEDGKKSLAWSLTLQARDKTLTNEAATAVRGRIVKALADELGATIRS